MYLPIRKLRAATFLPCDVGHSSEEIDCERYGADWGGFKTTKSFLLSTSFTQGARQGGRLGYVANAPPLADRYLLPLVTSVGWYEFPKVFTNTFPRLHSHGRLHEMEDLSRPFGGSSWKASFTRPLIPNFTLGDIAVGTS